MEPLGLDGAWVLTPRIHQDGRGSLLQLFRGDELAGCLGYRPDVAQANCSVSRRGVIRRPLRGCAARTGEIRYLPERRGPRRWGRSQGPARPPSGAGRRYVSMTRPGAPFTSRKDSVTRSWHSVTGQQFCTSARPLMLPPASTAFTRSIPTSVSAGLAASIRSCRTRTPQRPALKRHWLSACCRAAANASTTPPGWEAAEPGQPSAHATYG
jgi:dTDP-4-dehydrorhamnose 3,5-epimerase